MIYFDNTLLTYNLENLWTSLRMNVDTNVNVCTIVSVSLSLHEKLWIVNIMFVCMNVWKKRIKKNRFFFSPENREAGIPATVGRVAPMHKTLVVGPIHFLLFKCVSWIDLDVKKMVWVENFFLLDFLGNAQLVERWALDREV